MKLCQLHEDHSLRHYDRIKIGLGRAGIPSQHIGPLLKRYHVSIDADMADNVSVNLIVLGLISLYNTMRHHGSAPTDYDLMMSGNSPRIGLPPKDDMYGLDKSVDSIQEGKGPQLNTLKDNTIDLTDEERKKVMDAGAVWHFSQNKPSPAIKKAVVRGKTYYYSATHRCYQVDSTLKSALKSFAEVVEPSA